MRRITFSPAVIAATAGLLCLLIYLRTLGCDFVSYDDPDYVLNNPLIRGLDVARILSIFSEPYNGWWMPLTWIFLAIDYHFWGLNPLGYHLTNSLLHALNCGLVVLIANRIWLQIHGAGVGNDRPDACDVGFSSRKAIYCGALLLAGLLWGLHPLRVESVAWVTERKDVLNGMFTLGSILFYLRYAQNKASGRCGTAIYLLSLLLFALSLMAKSVSVVLPAMLLVMDWYPLNRLRKGRMLPVLADKLPFILLSLLMVIITVRFSSQAGYLVSYAAFPFGQRVAVSGNALFEYCRLMLYPFGIMPFYLIPDPIPFSFALKTAFFAVGVLICYRLRDNHPWLLATLLLFVLPLTPVLAFFQNGDQAFAARFTYLPTVAISIAGALLVALICSKKMKTRGRLLCGVGSFVVVVMYGAITLADIGVWRDSVSMWTRVIAIQPEVASYKERGRLYAARGDTRAAIDDFTAAIALAGGVWQEKIFNLYAFRGEAYRAAGQYPQAVQDFTTAISLYPHPVYYYHRGLALQQQGHRAAAAQDFARSGSSPGALEWFERPGS